MAVGETSPCEISINHLSQTCVCVLPPLLVHATASFVVILSSDDRWWVGQLPFVDWEVG